MNEKNFISQELLNAYVDDQLDAEEREQILEQQLNDPTLAERIAELQRLKALVQSARPEGPSQNMKPARLKRRRHGYHIATAAMLVVGVITSLLLMQHRLPESIAPLQVSDTASILTAQIAKQEIKLVVHLKRRDAAAVSSVLDQIETLLVKAEATDKPVQVELVANGQGLTIFRDDQSPIRDRINMLIAQHDNLIFAACQETMQKLGNGSWAKIRLVPGVMIVSSGRDEIARRKSQGWTYILI